MRRPVSKVGTLGRRDSAPRQSRLTAGVGEHTSCAGPGRSGRVDHRVARGRLHRIGPTLRQSAIVHVEISSVADFGFAVGPHSWKHYLLPPKSMMWRARRIQDGFEVETDIANEPRYAVLGVRSCDLAAIGVHDRVFVAAAATDSRYAATRESALIIAVNCGNPRRAPVLRLDGHRPVRSRATTLP